MRNQLENFTAGENITAPALVYFDATDGKAYLASASVTSKPAQAIVLTSCLSSASGQAYFWGLADYAFGEVSRGKPLYLSTTAGAITGTAPTNAQQVGFVINSGSAFFSFAGFSAPSSLTPIGAAKSMLRVNSGATALEYSATQSIGTGLAVGTTSDPVASAVLDIVSTTKGFGLPAMTSAQKEAIASPRNGLEVWDTDLVGKCVYDGVKWLRLSQKTAPTVAVGAGAGTGATVTVVGNDIEGMITLTGGTGATAGATFLTLTFFDSYTTAPLGVMIAPSDQDALSLPAGRIPSFGTVSTTTFTMVNAAANGIVNGTVYLYAYRVIQ